MRRILQFTAALLCVILLLPACNNSSTKNEPEGSSVVIKEYTPYNLMLWGDAMFCANFYGDTLGELAKQDGIALNTVALVYDNLGTNLTYNPYELFNWADTDLNGLKTSGGNGNTLNRVLTNTTDLVDSFIVLMSRDRALSDRNTQYQRNILSMIELEKLYAEHNPDGEFAVVVPPAYETGFKDYSRYALPTWTHDQHYEKIMGYADLTMESLTDKAIKYDWASAQEYARTNYSDLLTFDWTDDSLRHPSAEASYYYAVLSYCWIFDKSPVGMEVYGTIDAETAKLLQNIAHTYVFGTDPATVQREVSNVVYVYPTDSRFENEEYSDEVNALIATARAYYNRGKIIQYDQMRLDGISKSNTRRDLGVTPEYSTPQRLTYMDCSSFVYNCYNETFEYTLNGANSTATMVNLSNLYVYYWDGWSDLTDVEAIEGFLEAIKPGDIIVYRNKDDSWGHALLYAGNGMVYHSTGRKMSGGGSDYNFDGKQEKSELQGTVRYEPLSILTSPVGHHYMFDYGVKLAVLRPLEKLEGMEVTESAKLRAANLYDIVSYKLTTAQEGITVSPGDDVTFTYYLENVGSASKTVEIKETLPTDVTFKSGDVDATNGEITLSVALSPGEIKQISYTVTVKPNTELLTPIKFNQVTAGGIPMNETVIYVGKTLTSEQRASVSNYVKSASETATTSQELISKVYASMGYQFNCNSAFSSSRALFKVNSEIFTFSSTQGDTKNMLALNVYGGKALQTYSDYPYRLKYPNIGNFIEGDLLLICPITELSKAELWIYCGNGTFATISNGKYTEVSGKDTLPFIEKLLGEMAFAVLRPSQIL